LNVANFAGWAEVRQVLKQLVEREVAAIVRESAPPSP
jgi:hypothetical protein